MMTTQGCTGMISFTQPLLLSCNSMKYFILKDALEKATTDYEAFTGGVMVLNWCEVTKKAAQIVKTIQW